MKKGFFYLAMALLSFVGIGFEVLLAFGIEPLLYGAQIKDWTVTQNIIHWILTCILWGASAFGVITLAKKKGDFDIFQKGRKIELWKWIVIILIIIGSLVVSYLDWKGFKVVKEFKANGPLKFVFQYIYYIFEVLLVTLILVFSQKAFEEWFKNPNIPYGGIIVALTWGGYRALFYKGLYNRNSYNDFRAGLWKCLSSCKPRHQKSLYNSLADICFVKADSGRFDSSINSTYTF